MKIICFGDSNTYGYDPRGYFGGRYNEPWPRILEEKLGCTVINQGENGREIPGGPVHFPADMDLLITMLGTNDLLQGALAEAVRDRMARFLEKLDSGRVFLIAPPPMKLGLWVTDRELIAESEALAAHYRALAEELGLGFADAGRWGISLAYDGVHLTEDGHRTFAGSLYEALTTIVEKENEG